MFTSLAKAFPPAKVIFTGISVLLGVRTLAQPFRGLSQSNAEVL